MPQVKSKTERMAQAEHTNAELTQPLATERGAVKQCNAFYT